MQEKSWVMHLLLEFKFHFFPKNFNQVQLWRIGWQVTDNQLLLNHPVRYFFFEFVTGMNAGIINHYYGIAVIRAMLGFFHSGCKTFKCFDNCVSVYGTYYWIIKQIIASVHKPQYIDALTFHRWNS